MVPDFIQLVGTRDVISVFGIPSPVADYSGSFLPVIIGVWIMSYIYKFLNRYIPATLKTILIPLITILVMTPVMFVICAPLGTYVGNVVSNIFTAVPQANIVIRIIGTIVLAIIMPYLVLGGMHGALLSFAIITYTQNGNESFLLPIMLAYNFAVFGVAFGLFAGIFTPVYYAFSAATIFTFWVPWAGGSTLNLVYGIALMVIAFFGSAIPAYLNEYNED